MGTGLVGIKTMFQLAKQPAFRSRDLDETRGYIGQILKHHQLEIERRNVSLNASIAKAAFGPFSLMSLQHGADVFIDPECLFDFYAFQIPVEGVADYSIDGQSIEAMPGRACLISPTHRVQMRFKADCRHYILRVDRDYLEAVLAEELDSVPGRPLVFAPDIDLTDTGAAGIVSLLSYLDGRVSEGDPAYAQRSVANDAASLLVRTMLHSLPSNYSARLEAVRDCTVLPRHMKRAKNYVAANISKKITPLELAQAASISVRALYRGFRDYFEATPMEYVKSQKLDAIHAILQRSDSIASVGELAYGFGFDHLGHFAASYRKRYGELPSHTLRLS